jgi:uncharacterized protein
VRRLIIDGYNVVYSVARYADLARRDIDAARDRLINDLGARAVGGQPVVVVFDGTSNPMSDGSPHEVGGVTVIFSPAGTSADSVIEALASEARTAGDETEVITSDGATRWTSMGGTVTVTRATTFARDLESDERDWRERHEAPRPRRTIGERVDADVRAHLDRMAGRSDRESS